MLFFIIFLFFYFFAVGFVVLVVILPSAKDCPRWQQSEQGPHCMRSGCSCWGWYCTKAVAGAAGLLAVMGGCTAPV